MDESQGRPPLRPRPSPALTAQKTDAIRRLALNCLRPERPDSQAFLRLRTSTLKRLSVEAWTRFPETAAKADIVSGGILAMPCVEV